MTTHHKKKASNGESEFKTVRTMNYFFAHSYPFST